MPKEVAHENMVNYFLSQLYALLFPSNVISMCVRVFCACAAAPFYGGIPGKK